MPLSTDHTTNSAAQHGLLSRLTLVRREEYPALVLAFSYFFCLLCSYYILRPLRDEMGVRSGVEQMQWLFSATFLVMLLAVPLFAMAASRYSRTRLIQIVNGFFILSILGFWLWLQSDMANIWAARVFFVWLSVFNLFVVSVFWSLMVDLFTPLQGARLFAPIAAGGSLGAIVGPILTALLAQQIPPRHLLLIAATLLCLTLPCLWLLSRWQKRQTTPHTAPNNEFQALGGSLFEGIQSVFQSRYLQGICLFIWLYTTIATLLYFIQADLVQQQFSESGDRTTFFAMLDAATNLLTLALQLMVTAHLIHHLKLPRTLALVPLLVALAFLVLAALPTLLVLGLLQVLRRAGNYAITKPGREVLFTALPRTQKYKAKNFIDTVVYRGGDALAGWLYTLLAGIGLGTGGIALTAAPLAALWAVVGYRLGGRHLEQRKQGQQDEHEKHSHSTTAP